MCDTRVELAEIVEARRAVLDDAFREYLSEYGYIIEDGGTGDVCQLYLMLAAAFNNEVSK
jgi:hypothetical protein